MINGTCAKIELPLITSLKIFCGKDIYNCHYTFLVNSIL